jgi:hypothetical protein
LQKRSKLWVSHRWSCGTCCAQDETLVPIPYKVMKADASQCRRAHACQSTCSMLPSWGGPRRARCSSRAFFLRSQHVQSEDVSSRVDGAFPLSAPDCPSRCPCSYRFVTSAFAQVKPSDLACHLTPVLRNPNLQRHGSARSSRHIQELDQATTQQPAIAVQHCHRTK